MVLPIYTFGQPVLRQRAAEIDSDSSDLQSFIDDMVETMVNANGVGLAAPQVGRGIRVFTVDLTPFADDIAAETGAVPSWAEAPFALLNPAVDAIDDAEPDSYEEGCLSIPDVREPVVRPDRVVVRFLDRTFAPQEVVASGMLARVVQHELDHLDGILFTDHLSPLKRRLLNRRLKAMQRGEVEADYPISTPAGDA